MKRNFIESSVANLFLVLVFCLTVCGQHQIAAENTDEVKALAFGDQFERAIAPQQKHRYQIKLEANQFIKIEIAEKGCDVVMSLRSPDNVNLLEFVDIQPVNGVKSVQAAVAETGNYELRVLSYGEVNGSGIYTVKIGEIRAATEQELNFTAGVKLYNEAFNAANPALLTAEALRASVIKGHLAVEKFRLAKAVRQEGDALRQIANMSIRLGVSAQTIELYKSVIEKYRSINHRRGEANALNDLGTALAKTSEWEKAIQSFSESLKIAREIKLETTEAHVLNKLGEIYAYFGDFDRAAIYYNQSAEIYLQHSNLSRSVPLNNLGKIARNKGETEKAAEYFQQAVETVRRENYRYGATKLDEATYLTNLGRTQSALGKFDEAVKNFDESLKVSREVSSKPGQAAALKFLGQIYLQSGNLEKSADYFNQSLETFRAIEDRQNVAQVLLLLSKIEVQKGALDAAQAKAEEAINLIETIRSNVQTTELRDSFSANLQSFYASYVEILMQRHRLEPDKNYAALALAANERAKARGLLNLLAESNSDIRQGVDEKLLTKETELKNLLSARLENLTKVLSGKSKPEDAQKLKNEIEQIRAEYEQIQTNIRASSPRYSALTQPKTLNVEEIQSQVLDADSVLLEYALSDSKSFLWIVTKDNFRTIELPVKSEIEKTARQFYDSLTARNKQIKFETATEREDRIFRADSDLQKFSRELSQMILAPAAPYLSSKRLLIVADGALQYIPFAALNISSFEDGNRKSQIANRKSADRFLVETNEIVNLPSASALSVLRREINNRPLAPQTLAILADPIFDKEDERFKTLAGKNKSKPENKPEFIAVAKNRTRGAADDEFSTRDGLDLPRLPFTRREAEMISAFVPAGQKEKLLDFEASRQSAMSPELSNYRYIHFATHGFINNENPELSGIVLSLFDENGKEQDGFLRVGDIYNLKLPAELVVLSGCKTGLGKDIKGEGLVGMTRGFMYAGAKRVAVSLWNVNDEATAELMAQFYREMLGGKKLSSAAALRQAQIKMIKDNRWQNPHFWASFILQGEPK